MAQLAKKAILQAFTELLDGKPMDKITVMDIVERCDITRGCFYYHFQDIYAVFEEMLRIETERMLSYDSASESWEEDFIAAASFLYQNRKIVYNIYNSAHREELYRYVKKAVEVVIDSAVERASQGISATPEDKKAVSRFYQFALQGAFLEWAETGMKEPLEGLIRQFGRLFRGNILQALERSAGSKEKALPG